MKPTGEELRELLELAAKAAGIQGTYQHWVDGGGHVSCGIAPNGSPGRKWWNPLLDDGDSRRLQVALDMDMALNDELTPDHVRCLAVCPVTLMVHANVVPYTQDMPIEKKLAACRLAVLRNAAAIGRAMP